jgi:glycosyltransferase involved in cell wall biosynthesis
VNVLIIGQYFPPDLGGAATRVYNAAQGLIMNGCNVTIVTAFPHYPHGKIPKEYKWKPFKIEHLNGRKIVRTFVPSLESKGLVRRIILFFSFVVSSLFALPIVGKTDVIWAANPDIISMIPSIIYSKLKKRPVISNVDDLIIEDLYDLKLMEKGSILSKLSELIASKFYMKAKAITPISPGYVEYISQRYNVEKQKIHVVRGGVNPAIFKRDAPPKKRVKKFTILYSGAFSLAYDFYQILMAAKILEEQDREIEFILQGKGELAHYIRSEIKELKVKNVRLMEKLLSREEVGELLNQADTLILPLRDFGKPYLGISSKIYEYQAVEKPILCCAEGNPADYVKQTNSGIVVKPGDYKILAEAITSLKGNPEKAREMGRQGRIYAENNLTIKAVGLELKNIFEHCG